MAAEDRNATEQSLVDRYHQATKMPWED